MSKIIINFFKRFIMKYLTTIVLEKIVIIILKDLVKRIDSKIDDEIFKVVFEKTPEVKGV